jgi:hypothetical protein
MKTLARCLVLILPILGGCKGELAAVKIHLAADGSGECEVGGVREVQLNEPSGPNGENVLTNASDLRSVDLRVHQLTAKFASIDAFKVGDITFATSKEEGMNVLTVRIPVVAGSKWFGALGVSERSLEQWNRLSDDTQKSNAARRKADSRATNLGFEPPKPPNALFEINLPGKLAGQAFETVPLGSTTKISNDRTDRQASLSIPLAEIHGNKLKEVIWKIRYAPE